LAKDPTINVHAIKICHDESIRKVKVCLNMVESETFTPAFKEIQLYGKNDSTGGI